MLRRKKNFQNCTYHELIARHCLENEIWNKILLDENLVLEWNQCFFIEKWKKKVFEAIPNQIENIDGIIR